MSQAPSMPLFVDAYLADTTHLSTEEHGAYLMLLMAMWRRGGSVPDSDRDNARITGLSMAKWRKIKPRLMEFLTIENGDLTQNRLKKEWKYVQEKRQKNAQNGTKGGRPKSLENKGLAKANGSVSDNPDESPHSHTQNISSSLRSEDTHASEFSETFWPAYPHKVGRAAALKAFQTARRKTDLATIMAGLERYIASKPADRAWCNPSTFLNQERWADEPAHDDRLRRPSGNYSGQPDKRSPHDTLIAGMARTLADSDADGGQDGGSAAWGGADGGAPGGGSGAGEGADRCIDADAVEIEGERGDEPAAGLSGAGDERSGGADPGQGVRGCVGGSAGLGSGTGAPEMAAGRSCGHEPGLCAKPAAIACPGAGSNATGGGAALPADPPSGSGGRRSAIVC